MGDRPILFSASMVRAILEGRKTQTRRACKPQPDAGCIGNIGPGIPFIRGERRDIRCPYGQAGDWLWVRETFGYLRQFYECDADASGSVIYRADGEPKGCHGTAWRPSIHMPRWASRIHLEVIDIRVERLNDISEADARAEGAMYHDGQGIGHSGWRHDYKDVHADARSSFARLWQEINGPGSWAANPWVWVVEFKRVIP